MTFQQIRNKLAQQRSLQGGFTFVELLVVITIVGVIFASAAVAYSVISIRSRNARRSSDLQLIRQALELCRSMSGVYPAEIYTADGIKCSDGTVTLSNVPVDPKPTNSCTTYDYVVNLDDGYKSYTLSAPCAEGESYSLTNP